MAARTVLVFGRSGQLARELARHRWPQGLGPVCHGRASCDLLAGADPRPLIDSERPALVVNAAAYTAVDKAESEPAAAFALNRDAAGRIAAACAQAGIPLVHVSTDYVFDGNKPAPYVEDDPIAPISLYGRSKAEGEATVRAALDRHVILRTAWVYSPYGSNFVKTMLALGRSRDRLRVVTDQRGSPTAAAEIARAIAAMSEPLAAGRGPFGTWHFAGAGEVTRFELAAAVFERAARHGRRPPLLEPATSAEFPQPARRPANSALNCAKIGRDWAILPRPWRDPLDETVDAILAAGDGDEA
jgi:dTDP-4-dehydrorhamnose reductase